jgi:quercetin dioxygenase-like cupin family protein
MRPHRWSDVKAEQLNPLVTRQMVHTERMTISRLTLNKGAFVPLHSHDNEQITTLESGRLRFLLNGEELILKAGDMLEIPPNAPHSVEALEDSVAVDLFAPVREDWKRGDDAYLRRVDRPTS